MGEFQRSRITWTETARLQLVRAVIKVEKEIFENSKLVTGAGKLKTSATDGEIWTRIANLLPLELRGKVWSNQSAGFVGYKCKHTFFHLVSAYRDQLAGKKTCYSQLVMTEPVCEIIKRREDLLNARTSTRAESRLKSGSLDRVSTDTSAAEHHQRRYAQEQSNRGVKSSKSNRWTETTRVLLIKAVIQVEEEETRNKDRQRSINSSSSRTGKWTRVANILNPVLRGRIWNNEQQSSAGYICRYSFHDIVRAYRAMTGHRSGYHIRLTEPVYEAMKKREDLLRARNSGRVDLNFGKRSPDRIRMSTRSRKDHEQHLRSPTHNSSPNMQTDEEQSSQERSVDTAAQPPAGPPATLSSQHANESERKDTQSMSNHTESDGKDENLHGDMEGLLRRLIDLEFSRLSSWVQSRSTRFKRVMQEMTSSAIKSCMRCEINHNRSDAGSGEGRATGPFDNQRNLRRMIDYQILASFEKLRVQFTADLKNTSAKLTEQVVRGLKASPGLNHGVGEEQRPLKRSRRR